MPCSFRLRTKTPDNKWEDIPFDDFLREEDNEDRLNELISSDLDGLIGFDGIPGTDTFKLKAKYKGFDGPDGEGSGVPVEGEGLLGSLVYTETAREVEQVVVGEEPNTVTIERMTSVTFEGQGGGSLKLIFDNPPEGTP